MLNLLNMDNLHFVFFISLSSQRIYCFFFFVSDRYRSIILSLHTVRSAFVSRYIQGDIQLRICMYIYICII